MAALSTPRNFHFQVSADVLTKLGEELITDNTQALLELVKNAYDADAALVRIEIDTTVETRVPGSCVEGQVGDGLAEAADPPHGGVDGEVGSDRGAGNQVTLVGKITVSDTGHGLDADAIQRGWLTLSASPKRRMKRAGQTTAGGRTPLGDKGLGRLGAQRLGDIVRLRTRPTRPSATIPGRRDDPSTWPDIEHQVEFRFSDFSADVMIETVEVSWVSRDLESGATSDPPWPLRTPWGTILEVVGLTEPDRWLELGRLSNELSTAINPFQGVAKFTISVRVNGVVVDLERVGEDVRKAALTRWRAKLTGTSS